MTLRKFRAFAALWLALLALAMLYTDRNAQTYAYDADDLNLILITQEDAQAAAAQAQQDAQTARETAAARALTGEWAETDAYLDSPMHLSPQDGTPGLNLMRGTYEVIIDADCTEAIPVRVFCAERQSFITGGEGNLVGGETVLRFTLTDAAPDILLCADVPQGAQLRAVTVRRVMQRVISPDLAALAVLAGIVLSALLALSFDASPAGKTRRRDALLVVAIALFASAPLLREGLCDGHDLFFHLNRIEGIASALRSGQFPVRIHASTLLGYGYAAGLFYPDLFLLPPALLRLCGVSLCGAVRVLMLSINLLTALSAYRCARRLLQSRAAALGACALYTLSIYRLSNLYIRAALGENLAMIFFPLLLSAAVDVFTGDARRWPLMALSMTAIAMSHLLSTLLAVCFCALGALLCAKRLLREPKRILCCALAAALTLLCTLWFFVPLLDLSSSGISTDVGAESWRNVLEPMSFLVTHSGELRDTPYALEDYAYSMGVVPGAAMMLGVFLLLLRRYALGRNLPGGDAARRERLALLLAALGLFALALTTNLFPWKTLCSLSRRYALVFRQMQFPWRLVSIATVFLSPAAAWGYLADKKTAKAGGALLCALIICLSGYMLRCTMERETVLFPDSFTDTRVRQFEYTVPGTEKGALIAGAFRSDGELTVSDIHKDGTNLTFTLGGGEGAYVEVPLLYYPGYTANTDDRELSVQPGENGVLRVLCSPDTGWTVQIRYQEKALWRVCDLFSALGFTLLAAALMRFKKTITRGNKTPAPRVL